MVDKIKPIYCIVASKKKNQCLNIKNHAVHNIHRLAWGPRATAQHAHALRQHILGKVRDFPWVSL